MSRELARGGARVIIAARGLEALEAAVAKLEGDGHLGLRLDVSDEPGWAPAMATLDAAGPLHGLVAAAGVLGPIGRLDELDPQAVIEAIQINLIGTMLALSHALPRLRSSGGRAVTLSGGGATSRCHATTPTRPRRQRSSG